MPIYWCIPKIDNFTYRCRQERLTGAGAVGLSQGMAFTLEERLQLGIHGLLPPCFLTQDVQVLRVMKSYETRTNPLDK